MAQRLFSETAKNKYLTPSPQTDSQLPVKQDLVSVNGTASTTKSVAVGVLQGFILGPLLFIIYINDIPCTQNSHLAVYADDTAIFASS